MVVLLIIFMIAAIITIDVLVRLMTKRMQEAKLRKQREEALDIGLRLDYADEAKSLKRVTVDKPRARILAVDDEAVILDSFRKILVLAGYSVDTVESGPEALSLVKKNDYDFVFTDLKMPDMDGLEVTKAVKHLRPDIDVIMITGYATIESAVDAMKYGALDYVQKPFTEDELVDFVNKSLIRREAKLELQRKPKVHLVTPSSGAEKSDRVFNVPAGLFISPQHLWVNIDIDGSLRLGLDDFCQKVIGKFDEIVPPKKGQQIKKGDPICTLKQNSHEITFRSPVSGKVTKVNTELISNPELIHVKPYELGWFCSLEATNLTQELRGLKIGADAIAWYKQEIDKFQSLMEDIMSKTKQPTKQEGNGEFLENQKRERVWEVFSESFLQS